jgi:hypothetical protein
MRPETVKHWSPLLIQLFQAWGLTSTRYSREKSVYWVYSGFDRSPEIQKDGAAIYGECNCSVARSGPRDGGRWRNVPRLY